MDYYSARLHLIALVDDGKARKTHLWDEIVITFRARDSTHALSRALRIGRSHETEYLNGDKQKVRWKLVEIETLDVVGKRIDGAEVASRLSHRKSEKPLRFSTRFHPAKSRPSESF